MGASKEHILMNAVFQRMEHSENALRTNRDDGEYANGDQTASATGIQSESLSLIVSNERECADSLRLSGNVLVLTEPPGDVGDHYSSRIRGWPYDRERGL